MSPFIHTSDTDNISQRCKSVSRYVLEMEKSSEVSVRGLLCMGN